ncbi:gastrula zinc finger protein XlCGF46.1 [Coregonus clupeaformis]|uniref:gastrula zinc finger protein XlCGF46.1 n=1 Tax=Coregonus clupeaformis TaxID=59861 RepID=UPI001E1C7D55|nr:gastrula zinc finger protein XlCGF46.1 [Coregonus clupeaformis]
MSQLQLLREFVNERVMAAAVEIFGAVEKTVAEYQDENDRLRRLLRIDSLQLSLAVSEEVVLPEHQHCEQEWSFGLGQENTEATQIKEEEEQIGTSQEEEQLQELFDTKNSIFTPACVTSKCDQEDPLTPPQIQTVENRECDPKQVNLTSFDTLTQLKALNIPCYPPDSQNNASSPSTAESSDPIGLDSSPTLDPRPPLDHNPLLEKHSSNPSNTAIKTILCCDCGETFALKADLQMHVTLAKKKPSECQFCKKCYNSTCKLKAHVRLCHNGKTCTCTFCGKTFKLEGDLSKHMMIHTGEKRFSCGDCGKSFNRKGNLNQHIRTHTGEKLFSCGDCGKSFSHKRNLTEHVRTHTGEKPFSCNDCGKSFKQKGHLTMHKLTHTGEKPFSCGYCGKRFNRKQPLTMHKLTHTGEKPFSCGDCGKSFTLKDSLKKHKLTHTGEKPFSCGDCGKSFYQKGHLKVHKLTHTDSHRR